MTPSAAARRDAVWWRIFDPRCSLCARAALVVGGGAALFTVLVTWIGGNLLQRQLEERLGIMFEDVAVQINAKVDEAVSERLRDLEFVGGLEPFRDGGQPAALRKILATLQETIPHFAWIGFADPQGRLVAAAGDPLDVAEVGNQRWFLAARERPFSAGPPPIPGGGSGADESANTQRFVELAVPVTGSGLQFAGVLGARLRSEWATDVAVIPEIARGNRIGVTIYASTGEPLLDSGTSAWADPPDVPALPAARRFRGTLLELRAGTAHYLTGYARSRGAGGYPGLGWLTTVRQPAEVAFAPVREFRRAILRWGLGCTVLLLALGWSLAAPVVRRLRTVTAAAVRIRNGEVLATMPGPRGRSEADEMCGAVCDLVEDLRRKASSAAPEPCLPPMPPTAPGYDRPTGADPRRVRW